MTRLLLHLVSSLKAVIFQFDHALMLAILEQIIQDEMLSEAGGGDANDFMAGLEDLICIDDAAMSAIW